MTIPVYSAVNKIDIHDEYTDPAVRPSVSSSLPPYAEIINQSRIREK